MNLGGLLVDDCELLAAYGETCETATGTNWAGLGLIVLCMVGVLLWARR